MRTHVCGISRTDFPQNFLVSGGLSDYAYPGGDPVCVCAKRSEGSLFDSIRYEELLWDGKKGWRRGDINCSVGLSDKTKTFIFRNQNPRRSARRIMEDLDTKQESIVRVRVQDLAEKRDFPKTICPSEVARAFSSEELAQLGAEGWRDTMHPVRQVVWKMRDEGIVEILQRGEVLDVTVRLEEVSGPIRVRAVR